MIVIEPIFEEDFLECSYGFRPNKSAHQAIDSIKESITKGQLQVYDADMKSYFDTIPHDKLMKAIEMRIADKQVLKLIRRWLTAPIWEPGKSMKANDKGIPQGGIISPLLANLYMHWFDKLFSNEQGPGTFAKATLVRYADDFVVMARYVTNRIISWIESTLEHRFCLRINREKTKIVDLADAKRDINFLGYRLKYTPLKKCRRRKFCLVTPSEKSLTKARERIREITSSRNGFKPISTIIEELNLFLNGWGQYFSKGYPGNAFNKINRYVQERIYKFLQRRSQRGYKKKDKQQSWYEYIKSLGAIQLTKHRYRMNA